MVTILVFKIGEVWLGIETSCVKVITKNLTWIENGHVSDFANGIVEYEGRKMFVIDLGKKFHYISDVTLRDKGEKYRGSDFVVISFRDSEFTIPIGEVLDIFQISEKDIKPIPVFAEKNIARNFFKGVVSINDRLILMLDIDRLGVVV